MSRANAAMALPPSDRDDAPDPAPLPGQHLRERIDELRFLRDCLKRHQGTAVIERRMTLLMAELIRVEMES
jgi:hypothetical protein